MICSETPLPGVVEIEPKVFDDSRGYFLETYRTSIYDGNGVVARFKQSNHTHSTKGSLRGFHYQLARPQGKLIFVTQGEVLDVAVDIRRGSPTFGKSHAAILNDVNHKQLFIPVGFAHGFCVLSESVDIIYLLTDEYDPDDQRGIRWNDPDIGAEWPIDEPVLSDKDCTSPFLAEMEDNDLPIYCVVD